MKNLRLLSLLCMVNFAYCMEQKQSVKKPFSLVDQSVYSLIKSDKITPDTISTLPIPYELKEMLHGFYSEIQRAEGGYKKALLTMLNLYKSGEKFTSETDKRFIYDLLASSAHEGNKSLVKFLLFLGADVNANYRLGETALMWAVGARHIEIVKLLLELGANINAQAERGLIHPNYYTALGLATEKGYAEIVNLLKEAGARFEFF